MTATYTYDGAGLRQSKTSGGVTTTHVYDGQNIVMDYTSTGSMQTFIRGNGLIARKIGDTKEYYHQNIHGDIAALTGSAGNITHDYRYDAFGNQLQTTTDTNPFRYCGEYTDAETGYIYLRARYYDPSSGRFISEDPVKDGWNWYAYCNNNPVMFIDPWGLKSMPETIVKYYTDIKESKMKQQAFAKGDYRKQLLQEEINFAKQMIERYSKFSKDEGIYYDVPAYDHNNNQYGTGICWAASSTMVLSYYAGVNDSKLPEQIANAYALHGNIPRSGSFKSPSKLFQDNAQFPSMENKWESVKDISFSAYQIDAIQGPPLPGEKSIVTNEYILNLLQSALKRGPAPVDFAGQPGHEVVAVGIIGTSSKDAFVAFNDPNIQGGSVIMQFMDFLHLDGLSLQIIRYKN